MLLSVSVSLSASGQGLDTRLASHAGSDTVAEQKPRSASSTAAKDDRKTQVKNSRIAVGAGVSALVLLGAACKDGINTGFERIGKTAEAISNAISIPFSIFFPFVTLKNEYENLKGSTKTGDDNILNRMVYTCASLGFAPQTFAEPILAFTKGGLHKLTTIANLPHIIFTLFSYTGGRALGAFKSFQRAITKDEAEKYRLEQEFNSAYSLGNLGSAQASVTVMSENCADGLLLAKDILTGNFSDVLEKVKNKPIGATLGLFFNSWLFPFEWAAKIFDTTIRCAENVDNFKNLIGTDSIAVKWLNACKKVWAENSNNKDSLIGKILHHGREFAKVESLLGPPIGMMTVVLPAFDRFLRGDFFNKEAQELDGFIGKGIGLFDKITSTIAFLGHTYFTGLYGLTIRLPQTLTTSTFYLTHLYNKFKGHKQGDRNYVDPLDVREKIFNNKVINKISNWAEGKLNKIEEDLHGENANKVDPISKESKYIRNYTQIMAKEVVYEPRKEKYFAELVKANSGKKPGQREWGEYLKANRENVLKEFEPKLERYYERSAGWDASKISYMKHGKGQQDWKKIITLATEMLDQEINTCLKEKDPNEIKHTPNNVKLPDTFWGLLSNPKALLEVLKLRTFHVTNSVLPLFIKGFMNVVDFGRKGEDFWYRNHKAQETGIREGDYIQATDREAVPVFMLNYQNAGKGAAKVYKAFQSVFGMAA